jgi:putative DNA primase/helicase
MFDVCPAHGARAPAAGTGKSYLFDVVSAIVLGEKCPVISVSEKPDETEKRVVGAALSGQLIINFDNVNGTLGGDTLCQLAERPILSLRPLGQSGHVRVENRSIVFFNGNNCRVHGDMTRRVLLADLDAGVERPAERKFKSNPVAKVRKNRGTYIAACMTVLRAYIVAGRPEQELTPMNSYEQWSGVVRSALVWLNRADPCLTVQKVRDEDPELQRLSAFIAAAKFHIDGEENALAASDLARRAQEGGNTGALSGGQREWEPRHPDLHAFALEFLSRNGKPDAHRLGMWLGQNTHRIVSAEDNSGKSTIRLRIARIRDKKRKLDKWYIEDVTPKSLAGAGGACGTDFQPRPKNCTAQILRMEPEKAPRAPELPPISSPNREQRH